ncbi:bifunctional diaminohydroxyphosphoribosylaminopyrimidine deaminase/5-amino-6-(5-phosphoribosylamino)uracil reductase RibD [Saccharibacter sp. 17.LH.SD]|nr:bifunctional diaminohydroxyphosphoribosylaminopyrimidine deaminase/5-amino-6-(5-phosphoribosylamino)uracil reductase RibD [Saccharibacter sp. 17.LH.SD]
MAVQRAVPTLGATSPNPSVACVLLDKHGSVLTIGVHEAAGKPHAEVVALEAARQGNLLEHVHTALVTLEPCAHHGRTPPCSERLRQSPVKEVWIGVRDPNPVATGGGEALKHGEGAKHVFFLEDQPKYAAEAQQCRALLTPFASRIKRKRPWITVKQALNVSGKMEPPVGQRTFTSSASLILAHRLRRAVDAIVTGIGTVLSDDPSFTVRHVDDHAGYKPRFLVVMDRSQRLPEGWRQAREEDGFIVETCSDIQALPHTLEQKGVNWALVEGGPSLLRTLEHEALWDDWLTIQQGHKGEADTATWKQRKHLDGMVSPLVFFQPDGEV